MKINKDSLAARVRRLSKTEGIPAQALYSRFFFDALLTRLARSPYRDNFVLKGGVLISSVFGMARRSTIDLDFLLQKESLNLAKLIKVFQEIGEEKSCQDGVRYLFVGSEKIREEDIYGGYSLKFVGCLENVRVSFSIDIATGDPVAPEIENYDYHCLVSGETIHLWAYPFETVIGEKMETVLARGVANSRTKDFYDLYLLFSERRDSFKKENLQKAFALTCQHRGYLQTKEEMQKTMQVIETSPILQERWKAFTQKKEYAQGLSWLKIRQSLEGWANLLF